MEVLEHRWGEDVGSLGGPFDLVLACGGLSHNCNLRHTLNWAPETCSLPPVHCSGRRRYGVAMHALSLQSCCPAYRYL